MTAFILFGFVSTPSGVITRPKYATSVRKNSLLSSCILKLAFLNLSKTSFSLEMGSSSDIEKAMISSR